MRSNKQIPTRKPTRRRGRNTKQGSKPTKRVPLRASVEHIGVEHIEEGRYPELILQCKQAPGTSNQGGLPSLVDAMEDYFVDLLAEGNPPSVVCDLAGLSKRTYNHWVKRGLAFEEAMEEGRVDWNSKQTQLEESYYRFMVACRRAAAAFLRTRNTGLNAPGNDYWRRDFQVLERRDRDTWGKEFAEDRHKNSEDYAPDDAFL